MTTARYDTVANIVSQAAVELGLGTISDVFGSTDANVVRLRYLLNSCGKELGASYPWPGLQKRTSFTAAAHVDPITYGVNTPATDVLYVIPGTFYNDTEDEPLIDATIQAWEQQYTTSAQSIDSLVRYDGDQIRLFPDQSGDTISYVYQSRFWATTTGGTAPTLAAVTANTDVVWLDPLLITRLLKMRWKLELGHDATSAIADYEQALAMYQGMHKPSPKLSIAGARVFPLLSGRNVPDGGYGS